MATLAYELPVGITEDVSIAVKTLTGDLICLTVDPYSTDVDLSRMIYETDSVAYPLESLSLTRLYSAPREWGLHDDELFLLLVDTCRACEDLLQAEPMMHCEGNVTALYTYQHTPDLIRHFCNLPEESWIKLEQQATELCLKNGVEIHRGCGIHMYTRYGIFSSQEMGVHYILRRESSDRWRRYLLVDGEMDKECMGSFESLMTLYGCFYRIAADGSLLPPTYGISSLPH